MYSKRQNNLSFTTGDAHDFAKVDAAFHAAQNRRSERQKQKFLSFTITDFWVALSEKKTRNMGSYFETVPKMDEISQEEAKAVGVKSNID